MKVHILFIASTMSLSLHSFSQEKSPSIIAAGGGAGATSSIALEWTLGEIATETIKSPQNLYTQGYHQPELTVKKITPITKMRDSHKISVYPNPASSTLNIQLDFTPQSTLSVLLLDMRGRLLVKKQIPPNNVSLQLDVSHYASATYLLRVSNLNGSIFQSYKIIKAK